MKELNIINKRKYNELLNAIEYHYYSKSYKKVEDKANRKGIKIIKEFIQMLYNKLNN